MKKNGTADVLKMDVGGFFMAMKQGESYVWR
jgi:hypothetical protein